MFMQPFLRRIIASALPGVVSNRLMMASTAAEKTNLERAQFALGCFWGSEAAFGVLPGVERVSVGYTGGKKVSPTYRALDDHTEAIEVEFDPNEISYNRLLDTFWREHDPTQKHKTQYKSAIFYQNDEQKAAAEQAKTAVEKQLGRPVATEILPASKYYLAEDYHQKYFFRNSPLYKHLGLNDRDLIRSNVAGRLNGHVRGYGDSAQFEKEWQQWGITDKHAEYLRDIMAQGPQGEC